MKKSQEGGFSLIELMIAMVVTLIISGAVYGLIASGNTAFKRDPELTERQQNIRVAMDLIQRDLQMAGNKMGAFEQIFMPGLNDNAGSGIASPSGITDAIRMIGDAGDCPQVPTKNGACPGPDCPVSGSGANLNFAIPPPPSCYLDQQFVLIVYQNGAHWGFAHNVHSADSINFPAGQNAASQSETQCNAALGSYDGFCGPPPSAGSGLRPLGMASAALVRYEVAAIPSDLDNLGNQVPGLYRSGSGGLDTDGNYVRAPGVGSTANWQLVGRGIEELQVQYRHVTGTWENVPRVFNPAVSLDQDFTKIVRDVRVTLRARTINLEGSVDIGVNALRGDLTSVNVIRSGLLYLTGAPPGQTWQ